MSANEQMLEWLDRLRDGVANQNAEAERICVAAMAAKEMLVVLRDWDEPGACGCDTATCRATCLPARTRFALAAAKKED